ncbi:ParA family protein [Leptospira adleri]|uniref:Chromosome partitioning protein ParA n=1 Tax=Leptospira adleri TaxID=2023186 RepID=A0A2M9YMZ1_9LEPT|nr:AAA family ATPase [Leptospira adleri]PJZ52894.1 chromosome partitioning protein ParA [Leptospira adleri]PJZ62526.1 chromosome partitioning protein ParA [Leptospira adleri]TGM58800.1 ParA family protein [Leptospira adleri]
MIVVSIANQKGGEGKTTTSLNLAMGLARRGKKTLLVDIDPQANSTGIFINPETLDKSMHGVFNSRMNIKEIMVDTKLPNLFLAPSKTNLAEVETLSGSSVDAPYILRDALQGLEGFDFCVIDCPPSLSIFTINALVGSNYVIIPLQAEKFSVDGIVGLQQTITSIKKRINPNLEILGALITQLKPQTLLTKTIVPVLTKYFRIFETSISDGVAVGESHLAKKSVFEYNKSSKQAQEYEGFIEEFLNELKK